MNQVDILLVFLFSIGVLPVALMVLLSARKRHLQTKTFLTGPAGAALKQYRGPGIQTHSALSLASNLYSVVFWGCCLLAAVCVIGLLSSAVPTWKLYTDPAAANLRVPSYWRTIVTAAAGITAFVNFGIAVFSFKLWTAHRNLLESPDALRQISYAVEVKPVTLTLEASKKDLQDTMTTSIFMGLIFAGAVIRELI